MIVESLLPTRSSTQAKKTEELTPGFSSEKHDPAFQLSSRDTEVASSIMRSDMWSLSLTLQKPPN